MGKKQEKQQEKKPKAVSSKPSSGNHFSKLLPGIIIAVFGFLIYTNSINNEYVLDDFSVISENNVVTQGTAAIPTIFKTSYRYGYFNLDDGLYRPLTLAMFAIEWEYFPNQPAVAHFINVLLYSLCCFVVWLVLSRFWKNENPLLAFGIVLLFAAHPIHTEVVANIKSRDEILCMLLAFLSIERLQSYFERKSVIKLLSAGLLFFLALLSKETAITMLAVVPFGFALFDKRDFKSSLFSALPLVVVTGVYLAIRSAVLGGKLTDTSVSVLDNFLVAAPDGLTKVASALKVMMLYLKLLIVPHPLLYDYSYNKIPLTGFGDVWVLLSLMIIVAGVVAGILFYKKHPILSFGILFFAATYSLFSNLILTIGAGMGERFVFFASLGFIMVAVYGLSLLQPLQHSATLPDLLKKNRLFTLIVLSLTLLYSFKTVSRNSAWKDNYTLYANDLPHLQESTRAHYYLGNEIIKNIAPKIADAGTRKEQFNYGISLLKQSLSIFPAYPDALSQLGVAYYKTENYDSAIIYSEQALKYRPDDIITLSNLGSCYFNKGRYQEAIDLYKRAIRLNPRYEDAIMNLGNAYGMTQQYDRAIEQFKYLIQVNPKNAYAYYYMGITYRFKGDNILSEQYLKQAKMMNPDLK